MGKLILNLPPLWTAPDSEADQARFINSPKRISAAATGSKTGKTMGCAIWCVKMMASLPPGSLIWWVAPYWKTVKIGFERVKQLLPADRRKVNESDMTIVGTNGVKIEFRSAENPDTLFGEAVHACVVDEGPRMREKAWEAIQTTMMQTMGPIRVAGNTDRGRNNWFYQLYLRGLKGDPEVDSWSIKTYENPHLNKEFIMARRPNMSAKMWASLIEAEFTDEGTTVFRGVQDCLFSPRTADVREDFIALPHDKSHAYILGLDLAKYTDYTVITVYDLVDKKIVYWDRFNQRSWDTQLASVRRVSKMYGQAPIWMDSTGAGEPLFERLQKEGANVQSFKLSNQSKVQLIEKLIIGIERRDILIPENLKILQAELESYEAEMTESGMIKYSAPGEGRGIHDDAVISLALAYWPATAPFEVGYASVERHANRMYDDEPEEPWLEDLHRAWKNGGSSSSGIQIERTGGRWGSEGGSRRWD